jgi:hypothetical protein
VGEEEVAEPRELLNIMNAGQGWLVSDSFEPISPWKDSAHGQPESQRGYFFTTEFSHFGRLILIPCWMSRWNKRSCCLRCSSWEDNCSSRLSMSCWKLAGVPRSPMYVVTHWYYPWPRTMRAVWGSALGWSISCHNLGVRPWVVEKVLLDKPMLLMHLLMSFMQYWLVWVLAFRAFRAQTSWTNWTPTFILPTAKMGLLNLVWASWMMLSFNHSTMCLCTSSQCASGILNS